MGGGSTTLKSLSGRSARRADGLSRNPPDRDDLLQQRTKDLQGLIGQLRGFSLEEFLGEEGPGRVICWLDLMTGMKVRPGGSLDRPDQDPGAGGGTQSASLSSGVFVSFLRIMQCQC